MLHSKSSDAPAISHRNWSRDKAAERADAVVKHEEWQCECTMWDPMGTAFASSPFQAQQHGLARSYAKRDNSSGNRSQMESLPEDRFLYWARSVWHHSMGRASLMHSDERWVTKRNPLNAQNGIHSVSGVDHFSSSSRSSPQKSVAAEVVFFGKIVAALAVSCRLFVSFLCKRLPFNQGLIGYILKRKHAVKRLCGWFLLIRFKKCFVYLHFEYAA